MKLWAIVLLAMAAQALARPERSDALGQESREGNGRESGRYNGRGRGRHRPHGSDESTDWGDRGHGHEGPGLGGFDSDDSRQGEPGRAGYGPDGSDRGRHGHGGMGRAGSGQGGHHPRPHHDNDSISLTNDFPEGRNGGDYDFQKVFKAVSVEEIEKFHEIVAEKSTKFRDLFQSVSQDALSALGTSNPDEEKSALKDFLWKIEELSRGSMRVFHDAAILTNRAFIFGVGDDVVCDPNVNDVEATTELENCIENAVSELVEAMESIAAEFEENSQNRDPCEALSGLEENASSDDLKQAFAEDTACLAKHLDEFIKYVNEIDEKKDSIKLDLATGIFYMHQLGMAGHRVVMSLLMAAHGGPLDEEMGSGFSGHGPRHRGRHRPPHRSNEEHYYDDSNEQNFQPRPEPDDGSYPIDMKRNLRQVKGELKRKLAVLVRELEDGKEYDDSRSSGERGPPLGQDEMSGPGSGSGNGRRPPYQGDKHSRFSSRRHRPRPDSSGDGTNEDERPPWKGRGGMRGDHSGSGDFRRPPHPHGPGEVDGPNPNEVKRKLGNELKRKLALLLRELEYSNVEDDHSRSSGERGPPRPDASGDGEDEGERPLRKGHYGSGEGSGSGHFRRRPHSGSGRRNKQHDYGKRSEEDGGEEDEDERSSGKGKDGRSGEGSGSGDDRRPQHPQSDTEASLSKRNLLELLKLLKKS